jgi:hypothetical protein
LLFVLHTAKGLWDPEERKNHLDEESLLDHVDLGHKIVALLLLSFELLVNVVSCDVPDSLDLNLFGGGVAVIRLNYDCHLILGLLHIIFFRLNEH